MSGGGSRVIKITRSAVLHLTVASCVSDFHASDQACISYPLSMVEPRSLGLIKQAHSGSAGCTEVAFSRSHM